MRDETMGFNDPGTAVLPNNMQHRQGSLTLKKKIGSTNNTSMVLAACADQEDLICLVAPSSVRRDDSEQQHLERMKQNVTEL